MTVADLVLEILAAHGVRHVFGVPGDAINDITNALRRRDDMEFVLVRHEEAGAFMASAQAKLTGRLAACVGTAGPGAVHLLNGLYDAKLDHAPVIAITGQCATPFIGTGYHQEVDTEQLFSDVAEYSRTVMTEDQMPGLMLEACKAAISAPGVAHISIPTDIGGRSIRSKRHDFTLGSEGGLMRPSETSLEHAAQLIDGAKKVAILAGIGAAGAREELLEISARLNAPIVRTLRAKDCIDIGEEACIGGLGLLGTHAGLAAMEHCDLLLIVGADFPYVTFYPKSAKVIQIEPSPLRMGRRAPLAAALHGHAKPTLQDLLARVAPKSSRDFYTDMQREKQKDLKGLADAEESSAIPIKPQRAIAALAAEAPSNAIFTCDTGTTTAWTARHLSIRPGQRYTLSSSLASMAFALPGAIGAQLAFPDRPVIAVAGDGGFAMLMADFVTAVRNNLAITCVIFNNRKLAFIGLEQEAKGLPEHSIDLVNPDFVAFARACGGDGVRVERAEDLRPAFRKAFDSGRPNVIDIDIDPDELILPPRISADQALNFGLAKIRETLG
ncbi:MAG: pyruvate oxidase [Alphaproteobacteria bacterium]|nr:pyruvate oxidase [Alphaproteobacteria bacterium]